MFKWILIGLAALIAAAVGNWWYGQYRSESRLLAQPVYRVLKQHDRALYDGLLARYRLLLRGEESRERFVNYANAEISRSATNAMGRASRDSPVRAIMTTNVVVIPPSRTVEECMALMTERRCRHLPVVENGHVVGIVSIGDLVKATIDEQEFTINQLKNYIAG